MRRIAATWICWLTVVGCATAASTVQEAPEPAEPGFAELIDGLEKREGLLAFHVDAEKGRILLEVPPASGADGLVGEYLYVEGLASGLGSNPIGLDRGQLGDTRLVRLRRVGGRVLIEEPNLRFRAVSDNEAERRATREAFAISVLWGGEILASSDDGRALVDLTSFLVRDAHGIVARLEELEEGEFELDPERSVVDPATCLAFPDNLEFEAVLTYGGKKPGRLVRGVAPTPEALTVVQHHSLIRLPPDGYTPRRFDPRAGSFAVDFQDYAVGLTEPIERRWIVRHRLEEGDELVYYVDPGVPEPVRSALVEGAAWWGAAFEAAGFPDTYRVEILPEGAHPLDVRYNVIQWVHRSTRGWSYGGGVIDPRTGEMIKGHVSLGSLRVRQDRLIFEGLVGADASGAGGPGDPVEAALARIRQLSAHEVGHTLGLAHNFAASTYGRASVMDYPAPLVTVDAAGELDLSDAYAVGVGSWDRHAVRYAYERFAPDEEEAGLAATVAEGLEQGLVMLTDPDARPAGAANPLAGLWDNGDDPVEQLELDLEVRRIALRNFGERSVGVGQPLARLEEVLVPLYFRHRYQLEAAAKLIGGLDYRYSVRGDGQPPMTPVPAPSQLRALSTLLTTLDPAFLDVPAEALSVVHPRAFGTRPNRELFRGRTAPAFDPLEAAATAADLTVSFLLQPERAARLVDQHRRDPGLPGLETVLHELFEASFGETGGEREAEIARIVRYVVVQRLIHLAADEAAGPAVRSRVEGALRGLAAAVADDGSAAGTEGVHRAFLTREIERHFARRGPEAPLRAAAEELPPGSPIGAPGDDLDWLGSCSLSETWAR